MVQKLNPITGIFEDKQTINSQLAGGLENYTSTDEEPIDGDNTYRIKLVLLDGSIHYSEPQKVKFYATEAVKMFPNPTDDVLNISFKGYTHAPVDISIFDMQGKPIASYKYDKLEVSHLSIPIASQTVAGSYMLLVRSKGKRDVIRTFTVF